MGCCSNDEMYKEVIVIIQRRGNENQTYSGGNENGKEGTGLRYF